MVDFAYVASKVDYGRGKAADKLGQPYTAYRITSAATGDFPTGWVTVEENVPILRRRVNERKIESALEYAGTLWYDLVFNADDFLVGDTFICTDPPYSPGVSYGPGATAIVGGSQYELNALAFCWHMPVNQNIGARIDRRGQVFRPLQQPRTTTGPNPRLVWDQTANGAMPLILSGGLFSFGDPTETASLVPMGFSSTARPGRGENFEPHVPGMTGLTRYYGYVPYLPGYEPAEGDRLVTEDGARYVVMNPYRQEEGVIGSQLALERMISQVQ